ncbi:hypothetical protein Tco_1439093 [Tanacetum coccineum]
MNVLRPSPLIPSLMLFVQMRRSRSGVADLEHSFSLSGVTVGSEILQRVDSWDRKICGGYLGTIFPFVCSQLIMNCGWLIKWALSFAVLKASFAGTVRDGAERSSGIETFFNFELGCPLRLPKIGGLVICREMESSG